MIIAPQLPVDGVLAKLPSYCENNDYALSQKCNGRRLLLVVEDGRVTGINKKGDPATVPTSVYQQAARLRGSWAFDGELVDGRLILFDMPVAATQVTPETPYAKRRCALEAVYAHWSPLPAIGLVPVAWSHKDKALLAKRLLENKAEGCVVNHAAAPYTPGLENPGLIKCKFRKSCDCWVSGVGRDGKDNIRVSVFDDDGKPVEVAVVTACAGDGPLIVAQYKRFLKGEAPRPVIDVTYLAATTKPRLVQPTLPRLRDDLLPEECLLSQLQFESKELLDV